MTDATTILPADARSAIAPKMMAYCNAQNAHAYVAPMTGDPGEAIHLGAMLGAASVMFGECDR